MRGIRIAVAVATIFTLSGGVAQAAQRPAPRPAPRPMTVIMSCLNRGEIRPASYMIACGDGSQFLGKLHWASWTPGIASGTGRYYLNQCVPNCAQGKFLNSQVLVVLWRPAAVPHRPRLRAFTQLTLIYTGKRPAHTAQSFTQTLWYPIR
jgi:hypothetical protein